MKKKGTKRSTKKVGVYIINHFKKKTIPFSFKTTPYLYRILTLLSHMFVVKISQTTNYPVKMVPTAIENIIITAFSYSSHLNIFSIAKSFKKLLIANSMNKITII